MMTVVIGTFLGKSIPWARLATLAAAAMLASGLSSPATADPDIDSRKAAERKIFSDSEIVEGFFKTTFGAEFRVNARTDRIRKFDGPVRIFVDNRARPDRSADITRVVSDIARRVAHLDIAITRDRSAANIVVILVLDHDLPQTIRQVYGQDRARSIQRALAPQCLSGIAKDESYRIVRSEVILVVDAGNFVFYDCAYEELLQALGPINDDTTVPWTMFNDDVSMGFFDIYDQYLVNLLYHPRIRPGMSRQEAEAVVPEILPAVRSFVAANNNLR
jgi:hypothetical protein